MSLSVSSSNNSWAPSVECINIGLYSTPLLVIDTGVVEAEHWSSLAPKKSSHWLLNSDHTLTSELASSVPKNYQDYLLEVITASVQANYSRELFCAKGFLPKSVHSHYSFLSWSQWSNVRECASDNREFMPLQKVTAMLGHFKQSQQLNVIHCLSATDTGIGFYRHKRTGIEWQADIDSLCVGGMNAQDFELLYHCPLKLGRVLIFPSNLCQSLKLPCSGLKKNMLSIRSRLSFCKPVL